MDLFSKVRKIVLGHALNLRDRRIFQKISLAALLGWVGLGADGLASSCYGPQEAYLVLGRHASLALIVALMTALTILIISTSYSHIIEVFPSGGGGYTVASSLLFPAAGMVSGCALLIDYLLDVTLSLASGTDAIFSFLPPEWKIYRLPFACAGVMAMTLLNLRGVRESVSVLVPIFLAFLLTHIAAITYGMVAHAGGLTSASTESITSVRQTTAQLGMGGTIFLILKAYGMGGGTYTGLEAVSNGLPILRDPKEKTGKRTMLYMAVSLAVVVGGLLFNYVLYRVGPQTGKTLNAVLLESITHNWGSFGSGFTTFALVTEASLLFAGAQTGFVDGPRVMGYMAADGWLPERFNRLSGRLVISNGVLLIGIMAVAIMLLTEGSVSRLVILFSINVFITFVLSQFSMVVHWFRSRNSGEPWKWRLFVNGLGCSLSAFILATMVAIKFTEGGWVTLLCTGCLAVAAYYTRDHYNRITRKLNRLNVFVSLEEKGISPILDLPDGRTEDEPGRQIDTAVILVNGYNGFSLYTLASVNRIFRHVFRNYVFIEVGVVKSDAFKDDKAVTHIEEKVKKDLRAFTDLMGKHGYRSEGFSTLGTDLVESLTQQAVKVRKSYPDAVFFGGKIVFPKGTSIARLLHNDVVYSVAKKLNQAGLPFFIIPVAIEEKSELEKTMKVRSL